MQYESIIVAVVGAVATVTAAYFVLRGTLAKLKFDVKVVKDEVKNSHKTNLRADIDKTHALVLELRQDVLDMKDITIAHRVNLRNLEDHLEETKTKADIDHLQLYRSIADVAHRQDMLSAAITGNIKLPKKGKDYE